MNIVLEQNGRQIWEDYCEFLDDVLVHGWNKSFTPQNEYFRTFSESGLVMGSLPETLSNDLVSALEGCAVEKVHQDGAHPQFDRTSFETGVWEELNTGTTFYNISAEVNWQIANILENMQKDIASSLGSPWRVVGTRAWNLTSQSLLTGANEWHRDGLPLSLYKLMIFPQPLSPDLGTLQVRLTIDNEVLLSSDSPTWILFKPSELWHRGRPPLKKGVKRYTVESSLIRSPRFDTRPFFAGNNARHPYFPWFRACYEGEYES